jgi:hypothetical protein
MLTYPQLAAIVMVAVICIATGFEASRKRRRQEECRTNGHTWGSHYDGIESTIFCSNCEERPN